MFKAQKMGGEGQTHFATSWQGGRTALFCTGRSVGWMVMVENEATVTCKSCIKRAAKDGIEVTA